MDIDALSIDEFVEPVKRQIDEIEKNFNSGIWQELYFQASLVEVSLEYILILESRKRRAWNENQKKKIENLRFIDKINLAFDRVNSLKSNKTLYGKLTEYRHMRNQLVHKIFYLGQLVNVKEMHNLGTEILEELLSVIQSYKTLLSDPTI